VFFNVHPCYLAADLQIMGNLVLAFAIPMAADNDFLFSIHIFHCL
jgi:hypothetical protein